MLLEALVTSPDAGRPDPAGENVALGLIQDIAGRSVQADGGPGGRQGPKFRASPNDILIETGRRNRNRLLGRGIGQHGELAAVHLDLAGSQGLWIQDLDGSLSDNGAREVIGAAQGKSAGSRLVQRARAGNGGGDGEDIIYPIDLNDAGGRAQNKGARGLVGDSRINVKVPALILMELEMLPPKEPSAAI